jgi:hypothetical protein
MPSTININWATVIAVVSGLAGVAGVIVTPIWGTAVATSTQNILLALSSVLVAISGFHATSVVASNVKAKAQAKVDVERERNFVAIHASSPVLSPPPVA